MRGRKVNSVSKLDKMTFEIASACIWNMLFVYVNRLFIFYKSFCPTPNVIPCLYKESNLVCN